MIAAVNDLLRLRRLNWISTIYCKLSKFSVLPTGGHFTWANLLENTKKYRVPGLVICSPKPLLVCRFVQLVLNFFRPPARHGQVSLDWKD